MGIGNIIFGFFKRIFLSLIRAVFEHPLSTLVFIFGGIVGGIAASDTWIGDVFGWLANPFGLLPTYTPLVIAGVLFFMLLCDLANEGKAERWAIYFALIIPSLLMSIPETAKLRQKSSGWIQSINDWLDRSLGVWIDGDAGKQVSMTVIALLCIGICVLWNEKYDKRSGTTSTTTTGTTTGTPVPTRTRKSAR